MRHRLNAIVYWVWQHSISPIHRITSNFLTYKYLQIAWKLVVFRAWVLEFTKHTFIPWAWMQNEQSVRTIHAQVGLFHGKQQQKSIYHLFLLEICNAFLFRISLECLDTDCLLLQKPYAVCSTRTATMFLKTKRQLNSPLLTLRGKTQEEKEMKRICYTRKNGINSIETLLIVFVYMARLHFNQENE